MANIIGFVAMSHSPFWDTSFDVTGPGSEFVAGAVKVKAILDSKKPDLVVLFGPDHMRNFFYGLMPGFCIGNGEVVSFGDYGTHRGTLPHLDGIGRAVTEHVQAQGFDPAFSLRMGVDHGIVQPYEVLLPGNTIPVLPIMIDCGAKPRPSLARSLAFGKAVGNALRALPDDLNILVMGSGGLSHRVKAASPYDPTISAETREFLIDGRDTVVEYNRQREITLAERIAAGVVGEVTPEWDRAFLDAMVRGDEQALVTLDDDPAASMEDVAGNGSHEVRAWLAAWGAWGGKAEVIAYEPVPRWVTGMGLVAAFNE